MGGSQTGRNIFYILGDILLFTITQTSSNKLSHRRQRVPRMIDKLWLLCRRVRVAPKRVVQVAVGVVAAVVTPRDLQPAGGEFTNVKQWGRFINKKTGEKTKITGERQKNSENQVTSNSILGPP
jgi:hypothetical protein